MLRNGSGRHGDAVKRRHPLERIELLLLLGKQMRRGACRRRGLDPLGRGRGTRAQGKTVSMEDRMKAQKERNATQVPMPKSPSPWKITDEGLTTW